jgi:hypothetical protein
MSYSSRPLKIQRGIMGYAHDFANVVTSKGAISVSNFETQRGMLTGSRRSLKN